MTNIQMPACQSCTIADATSFGPDNSMMCEACRELDDAALQVTEAGNPDAWVVSTAGEVTVPAETFAPTTPAWIGELVRLIRTPFDTAVFLPELAAAPWTMPDVELPGMWEAADFIDMSEEPRPIDLDEPADDVVNHPAHYTSHPSGVECITVTEHMGFNLGNAVKYIWRCDLKRDAIEDLRKARFYIDREISLRERQSAGE
ncbi:hypothetical protein I5G72_gp53 [Mycobacterium phage Collard]|uniref:DUF3310 domain-containing protein n=1 Tax=Mycobacterium phage Collard TaxID=2301704 RepID=A0A385DUR2_9CAUD|nr:hypothetical protein I5G72_gp53 [Mycobacterium phage Collard]AXQ63220.1 hypothetical protein SEA_COLLARD_46 [Mycobacterium phage Collard]UEM46440.1 hypothetical protein SEA_INVICTUSMANEO_46 [Mycobacterium phage InvictusManeo]